jgi:hypothetical protein
MQPHGDRSICPVCFTQYPLAKAVSEFPTCPECESEAISIDLEPFEAFLARHSLQNLQDTLAKWNEAAGFLESYKESKRKRIESVIAAKSETVA